MVVATAEDRWKLQAEVACSRCRVTGEVTERTSFVRTTCRGKKGDMKLGDLQGK